MEYIILISIVLIFILSFWFRKYFLKLDIEKVSIWIISILGWIFWASLLIVILKAIWVSSSGFYSSLIGPFSEEVIKFIIIYLIISTLKEWMKSNIYWLVVWVLVGLWFGFYENIVYIYQWLENIKIILFRSIFVWGLILHPLTAGIIWYMIKVSFNIKEKLPKVFKDKKLNYKAPQSIIELVKYIYINSGKSIATILNFFKRILTLDVTIKYLLERKNTLKSYHWHWPVEILYEWLFFASWIHMLYNSSLNYIQEKNIFILISIIILIVLLLKFFIKLFNSKTIWVIISLILITWFLIPESIGDNLLTANLIIIFFILVLFALELNKKINN